MIIHKETSYTADIANKKLKVVREFDAPPEQVWQAWTESDILDQWWAPKPWMAHTKSMDFREAGSWHYYMEGPDGSRHYCRVDYTSITHNKVFICDTLFCDENGNPTHDRPGMHWISSFSKAGNGTKVEVEISFASESDMHAIIEQGFKEGFAAAHHNLDEWMNRL